MSIDAEQARPPATDESVMLRQVEREQFDRFEFQRRYNLLRIVVPVILVLSALSVPNALITDINGPLGLRGIFTFTSSSFQVAVVLTGVIISYIAFRRKQVILSSAALILGVDSIIALLLLDDTILSKTPLSLGNVPEFALLLVPIVLVSLLGEPISIVLTTLATTTLTFLLLTVTPHDAGFRAFQAANSGGYVLYTVPISLQIVTGALVYASLAGVRRAQVQLNTARAAYERERELDRLKNQFIASINHELRTPLMALQGYLTLAREFSQAGDLAEQARMFDLGQDAMNHISTLVEAILDVRNIETAVTTPDLAPVDLHAAIVKAAALVDPRNAGQSERAIHLRVPAHLRVLADERRLRQVLVNLIANACKYSEPATPIEIAVQLLPPEGAERTARQMAQITVKDYGLGIPPGQASLLFQRFVRLPRDIASQVSGTGLGLALCRAYVESMGGRIWVESTGVPGEGSAFSFTLALTEQMVTQS
jgi:signal transduction histidine kinase